MFSWNYYHCCYKLFINKRVEIGEPIDIRGLGIRAHRVALHLKYKSYSSRLKTFRDWKNESQKPEDLAMAGFFFTGMYLK